MPTILDMFGVNIGTPYLIVFMSDGSCWAFNVQTSALTRIAVAGTFGQLHDVTVWQGTTVLIVDTAKGYFQWQVDLGAPLTTEDGTGNVDPGLHSWAVTFVTGSGESNLGTNSTPLDVIGGSPPTGSIVNLTAIPLGPTGTTARKIYRTVSGNTGNFKLVGTINDNTTTIFADNIADSSLGANAPSVGPVVLIDANRIGSTIATFAGRVWISIRRVTSFTAPNSTTDFSPANAGGSFIMTDAAFIGNIVKLWSALDVLWIFGEAAINQVSNVQVGTGNITTFSNTNISNSIGSFFPRSVLTFLRQIFFATSFGVYNQTGVTPKRLSSDIDGTIALVDFSMPVISALGIHDEILVYLLFCFYNDPRLCVKRPILLTYFDEKWYVSSQGDDLTQIAYVEDSRRYRVFATDGNLIFELFITPGITHRLESPLLDLDDQALTKEFSRLQMTFKVGRTLLNATVTPVTETGAHPLSQYPETKSNELIFIGADNMPITFIGLPPGSPPFSPPISPPPPIDLCNPDDNSIIHFFPSPDCEIGETPGFLLARWQISNFGIMVGFDMDFDSDPFVITGYVQEMIGRDLWGAPKNG